MELYKNDYVYVRDVECKTVGIFEYFVFEECIGLIFDTVIAREDKILFLIEGGKRIIQMQHRQSCCESVCLEEIHGDITWLEDSPILKFELRTNNIWDERLDKSETWSFYEIATLKGAVTLRWFGSSNGYYSERVDLEIWEKNVRK